MSLYGSHAAAARDRNCRFSIRKANVDTTFEAGFSNPLSCTSCTTPITSRHGDLGRRVAIRFPTAAEGELHSSRARFSETSTPGRSW